MSFNIILVSFMVFLSTIIIIMLGYPVVMKSVSQYEENFKDTADSSLSEMFIFIEPGKLFIINLIILMFSFLIIWLFTGLWVPALIISVILGMAPKFLYEFLKKRRGNRFIVDLPDALLSMSSMLRAGTNINVALEVLVVESQGPIAQEFGLFLREMRIGVDYDQALDNLLERMPSKELQLVVAGMKISREIGGSLAEVLGRLSETLRKKIEMEGKIKSLTAQGIIQGYVMTGLPFLIGFALYHIEPQAMSRLFTEPIGWAVCTIVLVFVGIGYKFIKKIVTIDV